MSICPNLKTGHKKISPIEMKIKVGIVGCGVISEAHLKAYKKDKRVEIVSVCDIDKDKAEKIGKKYGVKAYGDIDKMFKEESLDAISVCTPPASHLEVTLKAAKRGINILCEKPLAVSTKEAKQMIAVAQKSRVKLLVGMTHRFHYPVVQLRNVLQSGDIGKVVSYRNRFPWSDKRRPSEEVRKRGGILLDNGVHAINTFRFLVGDIASVSAIFDRKVKRIEDILQCAVIFHSSNGAIGVIELDGKSPGSVGKVIIEVYTERGAAFINYLGKSYYKIFGSEEIFSLDPEGPCQTKFEKEISHFIDCIQGREETVIDAQEALVDLKIIENIFRAGRRRKTLTI